MQTEYHQRLMESVCMSAAGPPASRAEEVVRAAVEAGVALLCDHGILVPPWVVLDTFCLRAHRNGPDGVPAARQASQFQPYDDWLRAFLSVQTARLGKFQPSAGAPRLDCLAALGRCWPPFVNPREASPWKVYQGRTFDWIYAYRALESQVPRILELWLGPRRLYDRGWEAMAKALNARQRLLALDGPMVDAYLQGRTDYPVHETFDAAAAHIYLATSDFEVGATRATRLASARRVSRSQDPPELDSIEDPHHALGVWTLSTLTQGKYGLFKLASQSYPRMAGRPRSRPPRQVRLHLEWSVSIQSLERPVALPASLRLPGHRTRASARQVNVSQASVLQAFVALLVDDWREALAGIPTQLHVRALRPVRDTWQVPSRGPRWKTRFLGGGLVPPTPFVQQLFKRTTTVELLLPPRMRGGLSDNPSAFRDWYCGCVLRSDLEQTDQLGESDVMADVMADSHGWTCSPADVPAHWEHVLVLDPQLPAGWMTQVRRGSSVHLRKLTASGGQEDLSFLRIRRLALESMLDALVRHS